MWVCFGCGGIVSCSDWHKIVLAFPLHCMKFGKLCRTPYTVALCLSAVCCKKQQQQKTPCAQQCTSSFLIPCADWKLNVKHNRTTPKPEIHITVAKAEAARARCRAPKRVQAAQQQQQFGYVCIQARLISTNTGSMEEACEYRLPRGTCFVARHLKLVAVAGRLWISCCVSGGADFFSFFYNFYFFVFLRTHTGYCKYEEYLASCTFLLGPRCVQGAII